AQFSPLTHLHDDRYYTEGEANALLAAKAALAHGHSIGDVTNLQSSLDAKLSQAAADLLYSPLGHDHSNATTGAPGFMSVADKTKLDGVAAGATANSTDAQLRDRSTHTGAQAIATVVGLQSALDLKAALSHSHTLADISDDGTAASRNVAASGNASASEVVKGDDTRLADARAPTSHTHPLADVTDEGALAAKNTVATADIDADAVTFAKLQNIATARLLGRTTVASGDVEEISVGSGLSLAAGVLSSTVTATPGGSTTQLQRNNAGAFGGISGATSDGTNLTATDTNFRIAGSVDATKLVRWEVDGLTPGATRVVTPPDSDTKLPVATQFLTFTGPTAARSYTLPDAAATLASGTGTDSRLPKFTTGASGIIGNSLLSDDGTHVTLNGAANLLLKFPNFWMKSISGTYSLDFKNTSDSDYARIGAGAFATRRADTSIGIDIGGGAIDQIRIGGTSGLLAFTSGANANSGNDGAIARNAAGILEVNSGVIGTWRDLKVRQHYVDATMTTGGTTGAQTINKAAGSVNFAAGATSLVVTNNLVTTLSIVICPVLVNDSTLKSVTCVPAAGSFMMFANAGATAETKIGFTVINK
nr:hypothetical protein [Acidobacteriota bacterium]